MPDWRSDVRARLATVRLSPAREAEIVEELSLHLEDRHRELVAGGASPEEAARMVRTEFSERTLLTERLAMLRQAHWTDPAPPAASRTFSLEGLGADLRQAAWALRATPSFTIVALVVIALGIGATTALFSVVDAVVLRGLPFEQADRIVAVGERSSGAGGKAGPVPAKGGPVPFGSTPGFSLSDPQALSQIKPQNYLDWVQQQQVFESIAAFVGAEITLTVPGGEPENLVAERVTASFFDVLRIRPAMGHLFAAEHEVDGRHRVAVLSDALWQRRFAGQPQIVGSTITLDGMAYEVLGIMPPGVTYPVGAAKATEVWVPYVVPPAERTRGRGVSIYLQCIARLKPGVSLHEAQAQMTQVATTIEQANPVWNKGNGVGVRPLRDHLVGASMRSWMLMLLAAVGMVLLIACANVSNLLLARATTRQRDVAIRSALGAGRWRLVRLFMVESLLLSILGTAMAVVLAWWAVSVLRSAMPEEVPRVATIALNLRVLAAASGLALITGVLFGVLPALQSSRPDLTSALNEGTRASGTGRRRQRLRNVLVVAEVALAVVLVVGSALFIASFVRVMQIDPGVRPHGVLTMQLFQRSLPGQPPPDFTAAFGEIASRLAQTPGVVDAAAAVPGIPLRLNAHITGFRVPGLALEGMASAVTLKQVTPAYHQTLGIPLRRGRFFDATEASSEGVAIISEGAARHFFGGEDPVGRTATLDGGGERTIVGVVGNARQSNIEGEPFPEVYVPLVKRGASSGYLVVRTSDDPYATLPAIKAAVFGVLPNVPLRYVATLDELIAQQSAQRRVTMLVLALFGVLGLTIAAVGVYGVMAYLVSQRTREIGVRLALGATRARVVGMVIRQASLLVFAGVVAGGVGAWYLTGAAQAFLFGLDAGDMRALGLAAVALPIAALIASAIPARRAASVDPTMTLRSE